MPNAGGLEAIELLARHEGILLDPVYTGKSHGLKLIDQVRRHPEDTSPLLFVQHRRCRRTVRLSGSERSNIKLSAIIL